MAFRFAGHRDYSAPVLLGIHSHAIRDASPQQATEDPAAIFDFSVAFSRSGAPIRRASFRAGSSSGILETASNRSFQKLTMKRLVLEKPNAVLLASMKNMPSGSPGHLLPTSSQNRTRHLPSARQTQVIFPSPIVPIPPLSLRALSSPSEERHLHHRDTRATCKTPTAAFRPPATSVHDSTAHTPASSTPPAEHGAGSPPARSTPNDRRIATRARSDR